VSTWDQIIPIMFTWTINAFQVAVSKHSVFHVVENIYCPITLLTAGHTNYTFKQIITDADYLWILSTKNYLNLLYFLIDQKTPHFQPDSNISGMWLQFWQLATYLHNVTNISLLPANTEGPMSHNEPTYASVPGIWVYGMMCAQDCYSDQVHLSYGKLASNTVI